MSDIRTMRIKKKFLPVLQLAHATQMAPRLGGPKKKASKQQKSSAWGDPDFSITKSRKVTDTLERCAGVCCHDVRATAYL